MRTVSNERRWRLATAASLAMLVIASSVTSSIFGATPQRRASTAEHLEVLASVGREIIRRLPVTLQSAMTRGGTRDFGELEGLANALGHAQQAGPLARVNPRAAALRSGQGSDPFAAEDLLSRMGGMTQSETSAAWCGDNAAIGFNDSGSVISTMFLSASPSGSLSFNGWSSSGDRGASYHDRGALVADPVPPDVMFRDLLGDPVLGCTSSSTFYYASLAFDSGFDFGFVDSGISVSRSRDGATSFGPAVMAVAKDAREGAHFLDKPWMAVHPGPTGAPGDDVIHISYTDFDGTFTSKACPGDARTAIEYVRSTDGGRTWSSPVVIEETCGEALVQGSQVEVGIDNEVYVA